MSYFRNTCLALAIVTAIAVSAHAADQYELHEATLDNGLKIVTLEDHSCPVVAVQVWYHVGSKDENPERTGFAHMFEHMMFRGTDRLGPEDHFEFIRGAGGDCNAYTAFDQTVYIQKVPRNQLPMVLWLEAERMAALKVDEEGFDTERAVVEEERRMGLNQPYGSVPEKLLASVFKEHPYQWSPIGNIEHLRAATSEELLRFWETYYVPNNATLVVVGDVDHKWVEEEARKAFGWIPRCDDPPRVTVEEPLPEESVEITIEEERGPVPIVAVGYRTIPQDHPDALPLEMLMAILGGGESSRLYRKIVDEEEKAPMAMGAAMTMEQAGFAGAGALTMPFGDVDGVLELINEQMDLVRDEPVSEAELAKVRTQFLRDLVDESMTVESKASLVGSAAVFHGGAQWLNQRSERIEAVSIDDLTRVANTYFVPERKVTIRIKPTIGGMVKSLLGGLMGGKGAGGDDAHAHDEAAKEAPATSTMAERQGPKALATRPEGYPEAPPVASALDVSVPINPVSKTLDNGLEVVVIENHEVPRVSMNLGIMNGAFLDLESAPGAASMACSMLTKGTVGKTAQQIAEELESNAVELSASSGMDSTTVRGSALTGQVPRLARQMAEVVLYPSFPEKEFKKLKRQALTGKSIAEKSPTSIAEREFRKGLYGDHFYARDAGGTSDELKALGVEDCREWWKRCARPDQAVLYFAGDIEPDAAFELAEAFFGDWQAEGELPRAKVAKIPQQDGMRIVLVDVPGAIQSQIRVGHPGITRQDSRWIGGRLLTQVFGGAFNSRLNKVIRVEKGLTYGARGGLQARRFAGNFFVSTFSKTDSTTEAVDAILGEVNRIRDEAPSDEEISQSRSYLLGSLAGDLETPGSLVGQLWSQKLYGLPDNFLDQYYEAVGTTTSGDVGEIARSVIDAQNLLVVVVGDAAKVRSGLTGIAPLTLLDESGEPKALAEESVEEEEEEDDDREG